MRRRVLGSVALALALAACGGGEVESGPAQPGELEAADAAAGCGPVVRFAEGSRQHVAKDVRVEYSTQPPVTGDHESIWGATGTYAKEIPDEIQVHNLEHGHVVMQYVPGSIPDEVLDGLIELARDNDEWILLAPRSADRFVPSASLAFTAWTVLRACEEPSAGAVNAAKAFVKAYGKKAPERIPGDPIKETPPR